MGGVEREPATYAVAHLRMLHWGSDNLPATDHFTFDLTGALAEQLDGALPALTPEALTPTNLASVHHTPGIYQLYHAGNLVYVGKADNDLCARLTGHYEKISGRLNIKVDEMTFTGLYLDGTWIPVGPEQMLIKRREHQGQKPMWNFNGFGINDPGKERDTTNFRDTHFDVLYPADIMYRLAMASGTYPMPSFLKTVKQALPYVFRFEDKYARHADYQSTHVTIAGDSPTADQVFEAISLGLPPGWQLTVLPGYVILYKTQRRFPSARKTYRS